MNSTLTEKGQITIPKTIRDQLGLRPGEQLMFRVRNGEIVARKVVSDDPLRGVIGLLKDRVPSVAKYLKKVRG